MKEIIDWLMDGPAWVRYRCQHDLLDLDESAEEVQASRGKMLADPQVLQLISDVEKWESVLLKRHNDATLAVHKLVFLADLGFTIHDPGISEILAIIKSHQSTDGPFQVLSNFPTVFGGSGKDEWLWCLCDAPSVVYAMLKMGVQADRQVTTAVDYLVNLGRSNGWPCKADSQLGKFKGPGKREDPCPYANLIMLKLMAVQPNRRDLAQVQSGLETALALWENSQDQRPYLFKMGTDFRKLKVPFIWYDILHLADTLSFYPQVHQDKRFQEILSEIESKQNGDGRYKSESIWTKWSDWEFCQKREPSRWVTFCVLRILKRCGRWSAA
jgi:hypothetical protein